MKAAIPVLEMKQRIAARFRPGVEHLADEHHLIAAFVKGVGTAIKVGKRAGEDRGAIVRLQGSVETLEAMRMARGEAVRQWLLPDVEDVNGEAVRLGFSVPADVMQCAGTIILGQTAPATCKRRQHCAL